MIESSTGCVVYPHASDRRIAHHLNRIRSIRLDEWTAIPGSFAAHLLSQGDPESTRPERLRRMRAMLLRALETGIGDKWVEVADVPNALLSAEDRLWFTAEWNDTR